jgi:phage protein D
MAGAIAFPIRAPLWVLTYAGVNITADISQMVTAITYFDRLSDASGTLEVALEDHEKRWQGPWQPTEGDQVNLMLGYAGEPLLPCGDFQVDDLTLSGPPDQFHIRCLATYITPAMRTRNSAGYENQTLTQIASTVAAKYGLTVVGDSVAAEVRFDRITQRQESDLAFLRRLARAHNYEFTIRGTQLVFYSRTALEQSAPIATIRRGDLLRFDFHLKTHQTYQAAEVSYQFSQTKRLLSQTVAATQATFAGDTLKLVVRCENGQQAALKAMSALHARNMSRATAIFTAVGSTAYAAGNNVAIAGFGFNDGNYLIEAARHRLERTTGYTTELTMRRTDSL